MVGITQQSPFVRAFYDYLQHLPAKKAQQSMLARIDPHEPPSAEKVEEAIRLAEAKHRQKSSVKLMKRVLGPVVAVFRDYYGVLDTLCQADPTPGIVLWGALKIVIDGLGRFLDLFDKIKNEVLSLTTQLRRLVLYEDLYGSSPDMQEYLFRSYKDIFRFWCRVDKECNRCSFNSLLRASASFSLRKLQGIVGDIEHNADELDKLVPIIEGQYAGQERLEASIERGKNQIEREEGSAWRKQMQSDRIRAWLGGQMINEANLRRQQNNVSPGLSRDTCNWLLTEPRFQAWTNAPASGPTLWLFAGPGSGKSILCSQIIEYLKNDQEGAAVVFHFYEFDNQNTALSTARILASQLFEQYWLLKQDVPEDLANASQKSDASLVNIFEFVRLLIAKLPAVYLFIDGLDEELQQARWQEAVKIIDFLDILTSTALGNVRVWYSSQDRFIIREKMKDSSSVDIKEHVRFAVNDYVSTTVPGIDNPEVDQDSRDWILTELKHRADGNFLWASLMLETIKNEVSSFDEMEQFIKDGLPRDLDGYYTRIFAQYETSMDRDLACKIFALITFAKRRLRISELREAIGMISSTNKRSLTARSLPWRQRIEKLLTPLVETQQDPEDHEERFCHLFHSTVKAFLQKNPTIFAIFATKNPTDAAHLISEATISDACLQYLSQDRYSKILTRESNGWMTSSGDDVCNHRFLTYSAKYWDKHLDAVKPSPTLQQRTEEFVNSSNFVTTVQVQSLFVEGQFSLFVFTQQSSNHKFTRRVFPKWIANQASEGCAMFLKNYRSFISEWHSFLHSCDCDVEPHHESHHSGELDRCLWSALGSKNFLSRTSGRYVNFILAREDQYSLEDETKFCENMTINGTEGTVLRMVNNAAAEAKPLYRIESWDLVDATTPTLKNMASICTALDLSRWTSLKTSTEKQKQLVSPRVVSCSPDLCFLRIGHQLFSKDTSNTYIEIKPLSDAINSTSSCVEDITNRDRYLVLASRRNFPVDSKAHGITKGENSSCEPSRSNHGPNTSVEQASDDEDESFAESTDSVTSENTADNSAEESWSEGSTDADQEDNVPWNTLDSSDNSSAEATDTETESEEEDDGPEDEAPVHSFGQLKEEDDSDGGDVDFDCGSEDDAYEGDSDLSDTNSMDDFGIDSDDDGDDMPILRFHSRRRTRKTDASAQKGVLTIYDLYSQVPVQIFKSSQSLLIPLYESPPVIHPTKSLVVWPLCGGEVLFADFIGNTYFIRKARPSTPKTRHISMKCSFSPCGKYLHMVSLEAQQQPPTKADRKSKSNPPLQLSAFISTHRLSIRKTSRSPPTLIHRAKISLGSTTALCPTRMPVEVTWSPKQVYLSSSSRQNHLVVFRVDLFAPAKPSPTNESKNEDPTSPVTVPREIIYLPESARSRSVYFFPRKDSDSHALIIIGSWESKYKDPENSGAVTAEDEWDCVRGLPDKVAPPIGFFVHKEKDLGGWGESNAVAEISRETDKGQLKPKMERFVGEDDCGDLETYFFA